MKKLQQLSIIIPTYNRQAFAKRQMEFWKDYPVTLFVLDGSEFPIDEGYLDGVSNNIIYKHLPVSFSERLAYIVDAISTSYSILLADDEFFLPKGLIACIDELDENHELVSCMGQAAQFLYGPGKIILGNQIYQRLRNYEVTQDSAVERMSYHMESYICSSIYSVTRSEVWKNNIRLLSRNQYSCPVIGELQFELLTNVQGKSKVINHLMWLRSSENPPVSVAGWNRDIDFLSWYGKKEYEHENEMFISDLLDACGKVTKEKIKRTDIECSLIKLHDCLQSRTSQRRLDKVKRSAAAMVKAIIVSGMPSLLGFYRSNYFKMKYYLNRINEFEHFIAMYAKECAVIVDYDGISDIIKRIQLYRKANNV